MLTNCHVDEGLDVVAGKLLPYHYVSQQNRNWGASVDKKRQLYDLMYVVAFIVLVVVVVVFCLFCRSCGAQGDFYKLSPL